MTDENAQETVGNTEMELMVETRKRKHVHRLRNVLEPAYDKHPISMLSLLIGSLLRNSEY
jgi:hypothetical protein